MVTKTSQFIDKREIVCWGDSMTAGYGADEALIETEDITYDASYKSYPAVLQDLTHIKTYNFGMVGATSSDIVMAQAGIRPEDRAVSALLFELFRYESALHHGDILILEIGSNGGWDNDYDILISQYRAMIDYVGTDSYLILGDTDDPGTSLGDTEQWEFYYGSGTNDTNWEQALEDEFGDHFVNVRTYLIEYGLEITGLEPDYDDYNMAQAGCISTQLRSDWTHLNSYGYYAKACAVYEAGVDLGYWK